MNAIKPRIIYVSSFSVDPPVMCIVAGQDVTWVNNDTTTHTIPGYGTIPSAYTLTRTFPTAGEFTYTIDGKPELTGTIVVS